MQPRRTIVGIVGMVALTALMSCAYFNTLYNAQKKYDDAQRAENRQNQQQQNQVILNDEGMAVGRRTNYVQAAPVNVSVYEDVIEKCKHMIARYPDSRHVDDAMLLIGKSLFALSRYDEAVAALDSMLTRYPKTNLRQDAEFLKGKSLAKAEHYEDAADELTHFVDSYRKNHNRPEAFYLLCTSLMQLGLSDNAVAQLQRLEKDHGRSDWRYRAETDMASILIDKKQYKESLAVYERLSSSRIPKKMRYDVWMGMGRSQVELGEYRDALVTLDKLRNTQNDPTRQSELLLLRARAFAGADSTDRAINVYKSVVTRFPRTANGAEASYRLGVIYEAMDSLQTAQKCYQEVPRTFSGSDFAEDAIKRAGDIGRVLRLQQTAGDNSPEAIILRTFSMGELQLLQFNNTDKAIANYKKIVDDYPDSEFAPKAAYALGYIYGVVLRDSVKAHEWYNVLRTRYGDSQQAELAYAFYKGATPPPPLVDLMKAAEKKPQNGTTHAPAPADSAHHPVAAPDTTHARVLPDSLRKPVPQPPDTSAADTTSHGN